MRHLIWNTGHEEPIPEKSDRADALVRRGMGTERKEHGQEHGYFPTAEAQCCESNR